MAKYYEVEATNRWFTCLNSKYQVKTEKSPGVYTVVVDTDSAPAWGGSVTNVTSITRLKAGTDSLGVIGLADDIKLTQKVI
jgi:hypothetical protein